MASIFASLQVIAFLFTPNNTVSVGAEDVPSDRSFAVANSSEGVSELAAKLGSLVDCDRKQMLCVVVAPGAKMEGAVAEQLTEMPVRRFLLSQTQFLFVAKKKNLDPLDVNTVIEACRDLFPKPEVWSIAASAEFRADFDTIAAIRQKWPQRGLTWNGISHTKTTCLCHTLLQNSLISLKFQSGT